MRDEPRSDLHPPLGHPRPAGGAAAAPARAGRCVAIIAVVVLLGGGWLWLRDSSLVAVRTVEVTGSHSSEEGRIRAALETAALDMTTLHVREDALRSAVAQFSSVADIRVTTDFPHDMRIRVVEHKPVAALEVGDERVAAAASGLLLRGVVADPDLPTIRMDAPPAGDHVDNANTRAALAIAAAAPGRPAQARAAPVDRAEGDDALAHRRPGSDLRRRRRRGAQVARGGPGAGRSPDAAGATYLDLRIPERVAAGGLGPVTAETPTPTPEAAQPSTLE